MPLIFLHVIIGQPKKKKTDEQHMLAEMKRTFLSTHVQHKIKTPSPLGIETQIEHPETFYWLTSALPSEFSPRYMVMTASRLALVPYLYLLCAKK